MFQPAKIPRLLSSGMAAIAIWSIPSYRTWHAPCRTKASVLTVHNYYGYKDDARDQVDCTLATYAGDLRMIVEHFGNYDTFLIGHSLGGLAVLLYLEATRDEHENIRGAVLLEPSHPSWNHYDDWIYVGSEDLYINRNGKGYVYGGAFVRHYSGLNPDDYLTGYTTPTLIVDAGDGLLCDTNSEYNERMWPHAKMHTVEGADHGFTRSGNLDKVLDKVPAWMKQ